MPTSNTDWFRDAGWGILVHFLAAPPSTRDGSMSADDWNALVDSVDVQVLADQLADVRAPYFFLTIGQNSGHFCCPSAPYDEITGITPSRCSRRDLVGDVADALASRGVRTLVYLPSHPPAADAKALEAFEYFPRWRKDRGDALRPQDERLTACQRKWEAVIREWSLRWGRKVWGWWIDGVYHPELYDSPEEPNYRSFAAAMKAGNAESIVAFNPGIMWPIKTLTEHQDYTAGEVDGAFMTGYWDQSTYTELQRDFEGVQLHILSFLGTMWNRGQAPRFPDEFVVGYTKFINSCGGVVTWDVPITGDCRIREEFMGQLRAVGRAVAAVP